MAQTNVNIRIDEDVKKQAESLFADLGINMSTAVNIFIRQSMRAGGLPFEVKADPFYSAANMKHLRHSIKQAEKGHITEHELLDDDDAED